MFLLNYDSEAFIPGIVPGSKHNQMAIRRALKFNVTYLCHYILVYVILTDIQFFGIFPRNFEGRGQRQSRQPPAEGMVDSDCGSEVCLALTFALTIPADLVPYFK